MQVVRTKFDPAPEEIVHVCALDFRPHTDLGALATLVEQGKLLGSDHYGRLTSASEEQKKLILNLLADIHAAHSDPVNSKEFWALLDLGDQGCITGKTAFRTIDLIKIGHRPKAKALEASHPALQFPELGSSAKANRKISSKTRSNPLDPVIRLAQERASSPFDLNSVWLALGSLADEERPPLPLIGRGDEWEIKYQVDGQASDPKFFTRNALRQRLKRQQEP